MRKSFIVIVSTFFACLQSAYPQITTKELPISIQRGLGVLTKDNTKGTIDLPVPDMKIIHYQDSIFQEKNHNGILRSSVSIPVTLDLNRDGIWTTLEDGGKLLQMNIRADKAKALDFVFSKFWLPQEGKFFIFNPSTKETIGAITSQYLLGKKSRPGRFSTNIVKGDNVILEYYQPAEEKDFPVIMVEKAYYSYIDDIGFNTSSSCEVNVNCCEGIGWENEKDAVVMIYGKFNQGGGWFSGSLLNNTQNNLTPIILTANHCLKWDCTNSGGYYEDKDAYTDNDLSDWVFLWGYELANCSGNSQPDYSNTTVGAILQANNTYSDFAVLQLQQDPLCLSDYTPYYLGWDASGSCGTGGVGIHHPLSDVKKISTYTCTPQSSSYNYFPSDFWSVQWVSGITESGSSGSPLINNSHKVIGQLWGGDSNCSIMTPTSYYGELCVSWYGQYWNGYPISDPHRRLKDWIDLLNANIRTMEGLLVIPTTKTWHLDQQLSNNVCITSTGQLTVQSNVELMGNSRVIVESGGTLIINGGTITNADLVLKPGSTLQITNGGILETRNGFEAPIGAIVEILYGQII
jgi:hypothetical protein